MHSLKASTANRDASNLHIHERPNERQSFLRFKWNEEKKNNFMYQFRNEMFTFFSVFNASLLHGIDSALQSIIDLYILIKRSFAPFRFFHIFK